MGGQELIFVLRVAGVFLLLPLIALIDVVQSDVRGPNDKLIGGIILIFLNSIGAILYFAIGRNQRIP